MPKGTKCANPLFLRWVKAMHDEKDYKKRGGPPRATGYENAIRSLQTCTTPYDHPLDMKGKVSGVGPTTIRRLTERLEEYCARRRIPMPEVKPKESRARKAPKRKGDKENDKDVIDFEAEAAYIRPAPESKQPKGKPAPKHKPAKASDEEDDAESSEADSDIEVAPAKSVRKAIRRTPAAKVVVSDDDDDDYDE